MWGQPPPAVRGAKLRWFSIVVSEQSADWDFEAKLHASVPTRESEELQAAGELSLARTAEGGCPHMVIASSGRPFIL